MINQQFWNAVDAYFSYNEGIKIDHPRGTTHPRHPDEIYPLDLGYALLDPSTGADSFDVWIGRQPTRKVTALIVCIHMPHYSFEVKLLLGCTPEECQTILEFHNQYESAFLAQREMR